MNANLGREKLWNEHIWSEIDGAVREELGRIRVAQKVFASTVLDSMAPVAANRVVPFGALAAALPPVPGPDIFLPFFEISSEFVLSAAQVDGEEKMHLAASQARLRAAAIASAEDTILFLGPAQIAALNPLGINVTNIPPLNMPPDYASIPPGFVAEAANNVTPVPNSTAQPAPGAPPARQPPNLGNILAGVASGIATLSARSQPGPYALFLPPLRYGQTFEPPGGQLYSPGDQINHVATGGIYMVNSLPPNIGILVSTGGSPIKIFLGSDAKTAFAHTDFMGYYHFRVFERIQMVVQDGRAFQTLRFG